MAYFSKDGLTISAHHRLLADFAADVFRAWGEGPPLERPIFLEIGLQAAPSGPALERPADALYIGMQCEQMFDEQGNKLWGHIARWRLAGSAENYDYLWDLTIRNRPAYAALRSKRLAKVIYGPHIFPQCPPPAAAPGEKLLYVGNKNARRREILDRLADRVEVAPFRTFGADLESMVQKARGLLNIHHAEGVYTEYPRLLKAVLAGHALCSEPLARPLVQGEHYFGLEERPDDAEVLRYSERLAGALCRNFSLRSFLTDLVAGRPSYEAERELNPLR